MNVTACNKMMGKFLREFCLGLDESDSRALAALMGEELDEWIKRNPDALGEGLMDAYRGIVERALSRARDEMPDIWEDIDPDFSGARIGAAEIHWALPERWRSRFEWTYCSDLSIYVKTRLTRAFAREFAAVGGHAREDGFEAYQDALSRLLNALRDSDCALWAHINDLDEETGESARIFADMVGGDVFSGALTPLYGSADGRLRARAFIYCTRESWPEGFSETHVAELALMSDRGEGADWRVERFWRECANYEEAARFAARFMRAHLGEEIVSISESN